MLQCFYCGRWFRNKQALRAHLRFCPAREAGLGFMYGPYAEGGARTLRRRVRRRAGKAGDSPSGWLMEFYSKPKHKRLKEAFEIILGKR